MDRMVWKISVNIKNEKRLCRLNSISFSKRKPIGYSAVMGGQAKRVSYE